MMRCKNGPMQKFIFANHQMKKNIGPSNARKSTESAGMVKLVDTPGLGPGALCHAGSSPAARKGNL